MGHAVELKRERERNKGVPERGEHAGASGDAAERKAGRAGGAGYIID